MLRQAYSIQPVRGGAVRLIQTRELADFLRFAARAVSSPRLCFECAPRSRPSLDGPRAGYCRTRRYAASVRRESHDGGHCLPPALSRASYRGGCARMAGGKRVAADGEVPRYHAEIAADATLAVALSRRRARVD